MAAGMDATPATASYSATGLSLFSALVFFWVAPEHEPGLLSGITGNLLVAMLYVGSRTWGMPSGGRWVPPDPSAAHIQGAGSLGMGATAAEVGDILAMAILPDVAWRRIVLDALLLAGAALWAPGLSGILPQAADPPLVPSSRPRDRAAGSVDGARAG